MFAYNRHFDNNTNMR